MGKAEAQNYLDRGMVPIPVEFKGKRPGISGWQNRTVDTTNLESDFPDGLDRNVGVVLGYVSGGLVDVDLDCPEAVRIASQILPATGMIFGRDSAKDSHWIYRVDDAGNREAFEGPDDEGMLVEYRANGAQSVFPPSVHETGEQIQFSADQDPARVDRGELLKAVYWLAAASLLSKHWGGGKRHVLAMALSGALLRHRWSVDDVSAFIECVCVGANDEEVEDRLKTVADTQKAMEEGKPSTGLTKLRELLGDRVVDRFCNWLQISSVDPGHNQPPVSDNPLRCSDIGNAEVFAGRNSEELRYCYDLGEWLGWNGSVWKVKADAQVDRLAEKTVMSFPVEAQSILDRSDRDDFLKWAVKSGNRQRLKAMVEQSRHRLQIDQDQLDKDPMLLNLKGSSVNLKDGVVKKSDPANFQTKQATVIYDPDAQCPQWEAFLGKVMGGSEELISYLQRAVGYSLTGSTSEQCFFIAHGSGANGKSVFLNLIRDLMGDYGMNIPMDTLMSTKLNGGIPADLAMMRGVRMGTAMEGEAGQKLAESKIKQLTGGDEITARFLYGNYFQFSPVVKIWMATNHKPQIKGDDPAIWRRVHLIPFSVVIPEGERDGKLPEKLREELPGIFNWAVEGAIQWQENGLSPPAEVLSATKDYRTEMDTFASFCSEIIVRKQGAKTPKSDLVMTYQKWRRAEGGEEMSASLLTQRMKLLGYEEGRSNNVRFWKDISLDNHDLISMDFAT